MVLAHKELIVKDFSVELTKQRIGGIVGEKAAEGQPPQEHKDKKLSVIMLRN